MELFIPTKINKKDKFGKGFGKDEMRRTVISAIIGLLIGLVVGLIFLNRSYEHILISTVIGGGLLGINGYFISIRNSINLSVYYYLTLMIDFIKQQKKYKYKKLKEWY